MLLCFRWHYASIRFQLDAIIALPVRDLFGPAIVISTSQVRSCFPLLVQGYHLQFVSKRSVTRAWRLAQRSIAGPSPLAQTSMDPAQRWCQARLIGIHITPQTHLDDDINRRFRRSPSCPPDRARHRRPPGGMFQFTSSSIRNDIITTCVHLGTWP